MFPRILWTIFRSGFSSVGGNTRKERVHLGELNVDGWVILKQVVGPRRDEVTEEWRRLHNEELNDLYCSPNIVRVVKSRRMRWAGHVALVG